MQYSNKISTNSVASIIVSALVIVGGISTAATASADAEPRRTMTVSYADLNVDTQQGAKVLYARLRQAAQVVCSAPNSRDLRFKSEWQRCYDSALSSAVGQVNKIAVTQLYQASVAPKAKS